MADNSFKIKKSLNIEPTTVPSNPVKGDIYYNNAESKLKHYDGSSFSSVGATPIIEATADTTMEPNKIYIANKSGSQCALTLPATFSVGDKIEIIGKGATGWSILSNASATAQNIMVGGTSSPTSSSSAILPDYKIQNAGMGMYNEAETTAIKTKCEDFRNEFYRVKELIEIAETTTEAVEMFQSMNFPQT